MNLNALQVFQTAVNTNVAAKPGVRVGISSTNSSNWRVETKPASSSSDNNRVRRMFNDALIDAFDVKSLKELPAEVRKVLKIGDFGLSRNGEVTSRRPLTMRRIRAVMEAVEKVVVSTAKDDAERVEIGNAFRSRFANSQMVEKGLQRYAILSGRDPVILPVGIGKSVEVPLSALKAYTRGIPAKDLPSKVDSVIARAEHDVYTGAALYEELLAGSDCVPTKENARAIRHYMAVVAIASEKYLNREISFEDPDGRIANYLNAVEPGSAMRIFANDSSHKSVDHTVITSDIEISGVRSGIMRLRDVDGFYQKIKDNPFASSVISRKTAYGSLTVAQMYANAKAELARISTVGEEEMIEEASRELAARGAVRPYSMIQIGSTRAADRIYGLRMALHEFLACVESHNPLLDHLGDRIGDEVILSAEDVAKWRMAQDREYVLSPSSRSRRETPKELSSGELRQPLGGVMHDGVTSNDPFVLVKQCGYGNVANGAARLFEFLRMGTLPKGVNPPPEGVVSADGERLSKEAVRYIETLDADFLSVAAWYIKSGAFKEDNGYLQRKGLDLAAVRERPFWNDCIGGASELAKVNPDSLRCLFDLLRVEFNSSLRFRTRLESVSPRPGFEAREAYSSLGEKAAESKWGFGTTDIGQIAKFVRDCGYSLSEITPKTLGKLSALAALCDFRLAEAPTFIQRQTGKAISEITTEDMAFLFNLKADDRLNDKGQVLKGRSREVHSVLAGDMLPSATEMTELDVITLLDAMRVFASEKTPQSSRIIELAGKKVSLRTTRAGTLVFGVDGYEFRAAKGPKEFAECLEDDIIANVERFGTHAVIRTLPQIRGAELSGNPVERSRSRELCLRFLRGAAGIDMASVASVGTKHLFSIAEGVVDGRYRMRSGELSRDAVGAMLDTVADRNVFTSKEAQALYRELEGMSQTGRKVPVTISRPVPPPRPTNADLVLERKVHAFLADLVLDADPYEFDRSRKTMTSEARLIKIMRDNVDVIVEILKKPDLLMTFPGSSESPLGDLWARLMPPIPGKLVRQNAEVLKNDFIFVLDNVMKSVPERRKATLAYVESQGHKGAFKVFKGNALYDAMDVFRTYLADAENAIIEGVKGTMQEIEERLAGVIGGIAPAEEGDPIWAQAFSEIIGNAMLDVRSGYGMFMHNVLATYFSGSSPLEQRRMVAQLVRNIGSGSSDAAVLGEVFKGAGPLLHKMLQGLPADALGPELALALKDMKSNLRPIPEAYVKACMMQIVERSEGQILSVSVERSLGAASVGQAFLCRMVTAEHPQGEECVVKILRPDVKSVIARERAVFEAAAAKVPGMDKTFSGQLARILEELDFTLEATNVNFARNVYEQPPYLRQTSIASGRSVETLNLVDLHSMELHPLAPPTMGVLVLKKAPGVTYDRYMEETRAKIDELVGGYYDENDGLYHFPDPAQAACVKIQLENLYSEVLKRQKFLMDLTRKWVSEGLFGNGFYHGDLHAGNIMTDGEGLTVIDFGNATHLTEAERKEVLRMISAALVGWSDMFETSFKALLSEQGLAGYNAANKDGRLSRDIAEVVKKGTRLDVGSRIAAALMVLQRHGIEVPGSIYNFNQCQLRLGDTVEMMNALMFDIVDKMRHLSMVMIDVRLIPEAASSGLVNALLLNTKTFSDISGPTSNLASQAGLLDVLKDVLAGYKNGSRHVEEGVQRIMADLQDQACRDRMLIPLAYQLSQLRRLSTVSQDNPRVLANAGGGYNLHKAFDAFQREDSEATRRAFALAFIDAVEDVVIALDSFCRPRSMVGPETFLDAVGDSISDSVYSVRTTLGNVTAMNIVRDQDADDRRIMDSEMRISAANASVVRYAASNAEAGLCRADLVKIRSASKVAFFPFDMPGMDGKGAWKGDPEKRGRVLSAMKVAVRRIVDELKRSGVLTDESSMERQRIAIHVAMEFVAARTGGLFGAFSGWSSSEQANMLVELQEVEGDSAKRFPVAEALLYLFRGRAAA